MTAFYNVALDLPHAGTVATRIVRFIETRTGSEDEGYEDLARLAEEIRDALFPCSVSGENPPGPEAIELRDRVAALARELVDRIESLGVAHDRLGQHVRNLFECLELGEEGAEISLRAGEDPNSIQRPV
ncbi:MAG: hypothetical protein NDJ92_17200 [Thermoanaerobaculia bacterium]|nr:hypothetical protein [Thermoanaerobaculia bacterium]